jgi:pectinesterase
LSCDIVSRDRGLLETNGFIAAPNTKGTDKYGFLFINSLLKKESPAMAGDSVSLGSPWHPTTNLPDGKIALQDSPASLAHPYVIYIKNGRY